MFDVDQATIRRWIKAGSFPEPLRIRHTLRWRMDDLLDALRNRGKK